MSDQIHDLHTFMAQVTAEMASEYKRISARAAEDPGTAGDEGEENWANLLRDWLPPAYHVATKGRLIAADNRMSPQIDLLVLKPSYPRKLREKKVWLADGVAAVFECKTTLRPGDITSSAERCRKFKDLYQPRHGSPRTELHSPLFYGLLSHSHTWKAAASTPAENVDAALLKTIELAEKPSEIIDHLCVSDLGCWSVNHISCIGPALQPRGAPMPDFGFTDSWRPATSMLRAIIGGDRQKDTFEPVGSMISFLTQRLAWDDEAVRSLADYYRMAGLWGSGSGQMRSWPPSVYSSDVQASISQRGVVNVQGWSDWRLSII